MAKEKFKFVPVKLTEKEHRKLAQFCKETGRTMAGVFKLGMLKVMHDEK